MFDVLYTQTVTLFNRVGEDEITWYPTVLNNVHLIMDKSAMIANYGEHTTDNARVHIRYSIKNGNVMIAGKTYYLPKDYRRATSYTDKITFQTGTNADFIYAGEWSETAIDDDDYTEGFYNYMNTHYDNVFMLTSVSKFNVITHFEVTAK